MYCSTCARLAAAIAFSSNSRNSSEISAPSSLLTVLATSLNSTLTHADRQMHKADKTIRRQTHARTSYYSAVCRGEQTGGERERPLVTCRRASGNTDRIGERRLLTAMPCSFLSPLSPRTHRSRYRTVLCLLSIEELRARTRSGTRIPPQQ